MRAELPTSRLPLERFVADGGWPTNAGLRIVEASADAVALRIRLCVTFDELIAGCSGGVQERPRLADLVLVVDRATAVATVE
ncbi:MAG: hypothetical protein K8U03_15560 [Planctomycetia bacterium]|nr:hypothetical protein [Planctomycetia bacterium]